MSIHSRTLGTTIRIFLADGTADGIWMVEKSNWAGKALMAPRTRYRDLRSRPDLTGPGIYLLIGPSESELQTNRIYIGETDNLPGRLDNHNRNTDFWNWVTVFTSKDDNLNKAHIRYLEARLIELAAAANRAEIDNTNVGSKPPLSEPDTAEAEAFLSEMLLIYPVLGVQVFQQPGELPVSRQSDEQPSASPRLYLRGKDTNAEGTETANGFVVYAGSLGRAETLSSLIKHDKPAEKLRTNLLDNGILIQEGNNIRLTKNYEFNSASMAARVMLGRSASPRDWKSAEGKTLQDLRAMESTT